LLPPFRLVAYGEDTSGNEKYTLRVRDLASGKEVLAKPIPDTAGNFAFANDSKTLFYVTKDKLDRLVVAFHLDFTCGAWQCGIGPSFCSLFACLASSCR
jgi:protease II